MDRNTIIIILAIILSIILFVVFNEVFHYNAKNKCINKGKEKENREGVYDRKDRICSMVITNE